MNWIYVELSVAIIMLAITVVLLIKVVGQEIEEDIFEFKRRNHWKRWKRKRRKK